MAIEIEKWEGWNDLLKFRRGFQRRQIAAGLVAARQRFQPELRLRAPQIAVGASPRPASRALRMIAGGKLGDIMGRRRAFGIGNTAPAGQASMMRGTS